MKIFFSTMLVFVCLCSCKTVDYSGKKSLEMNCKSVQIDTLFQDKISIRAIVIDGNKVWYAADNSRFGFFDLEQNKKTERTIGADKSKAEFRSIAQTTKDIFILNVSNPALLLKIKKP